MHFSIEQLLVNINQTPQSIWQNIKLIIDIFTSIAIFFGAIFAYFTFKYKFDSSIRDLYIKSCTEVYSLLNTIIEKQIVTGAQLDKMLDLEIYAKIYLPDDIVNFIKNLHGQLTMMWGYCIHIEAIGSCEDINGNANMKKLEEKDEYMNKIRDCINKITQEKDKLPTLYRQHILSENKLKKFYKRLQKNK